MAEAKIIKKIGVLTSGGDAPGMNAAIRAITDKALEQGIEVVGVIGGYSGLINDKIIPLTSEFVNSIVGLGGTRLYSDRCVEFKTEEGMARLSLPARSTILTLSSLSAATAPSEELPTFLCAASPRSVLPALSITTSPQPTTPSDLTPL